MNRLSTSVLITYLLGQSSKYISHWLSNCVTIFRIGMFPEIMNVPFQVPLDVPLSDLFLSNSLLFPLQFSEELQTSDQIFTKPPRIRIMVQSVWDQYGKIGFPTELMWFFPLKFARIVFFFFWVCSFYDLVVYSSSPRFAGVSHQASWCSILLPVNTPWKFDELENVSVTYC